MSMSDIKVKLHSDNEQEVDAALLEIIRQLQGTEKQKEEVANETLPILKEMLLKHEGQDVRDVAAVAIGYMDKYGASAQPEILESLANYDAYEFRHVASTAFFIGVPAEKAVPLLKVALVSSHWKEDTAMVLGWYGPAASDAVDALISETAADPAPPNEMAKGADISKRREVIKALGKIGLGAKVAVPRLAELLWDPSQDIRGYAAKSLAKITNEFEDPWKGDDVFSMSKEDPKEIEIVVIARKWWQTSGSSQNWGE